jgi:hypothetical protein
MAMRPWRNVPVPRVSAAAALAFVGWLATTAYLIVQARAAPVLQWTDSKAYASLASKSLWGVAFWTGPRPPLVPLMIKVFGTSTGFVTVQAVIAALAWGLLAWTVGRLVPPGWRRLMATWIILAFATALPITLWNRSVLSESVSMSTLALVFVGFIWTARRCTWPRLVATSGACLCFAAARDAQIWTIAFLMVAVGVFVALRMVRGRTAAAGKAGALALGLLVVVVATEWGTLASHRTTPDVADVFYARIFPYPDRVAWFAAHGMPEPQQIDQLARTVPAESSVAPVVFIGPTDPNFEPVRRWLATDAPGVYALWLVTHPWYVISEPLRRPERAFNFAQGNLDFYAATTNRMASPLTIVMWPPLFGLIILTALAGSLAWGTGAWRERTWRVVALLTVGGIVAMLVAWHGDAQEVTRHTVEGLAEFRLGVWILVIVGLIGFDPGQADIAPIGPLPRAGRRPNGPPLRPS